MPTQRAKKSPQANPAPLAQLAYESVRGAIERGELSPGDRISEYRVADWLKISRTPAREGLQRLEGEGLLSYHPRRGLVVTTMDDEALKELFDAREVVESALAALAASNGSGPEIAAVLKHTEAEPDLIENRDRMYEHNKMFHELIRRAAHNRYLSKFSTALDDAIAADSRGSSLVDPERRTAVIGEHLRLAKAIAQRDAAEAAQASTAHIRAAYQARLRFGSLRKATGES